MKKKTIIALLIAVVMVLGSFTTVFAATGAPTDATREAIEGQKIRSIPTLGDEVDAEAFAKALTDQVTTGKYKLIDTKTLKSKIDKKEKIIIIDTMPQEWWENRHIPGAICSEVGKKGPEFLFEGTQKSDLLKAVNKAVGTKTVKYYWNAKSKKWVTKKPPKKYYKKCTKKKDKYYGKKYKKVKEVNKDATIIVYCGFTKCQRSHQGAMYLTSQGFKNVYRYAGGITAWVDAAAADPSYVIEGKDVEAPAEAAAGE